MEEYGVLNEEQEQKPLGNLEHYYMKHKLYQTMATTFLQGSWPVFPAPYWFEEYIYQAITLAEKAKIITDVVNKAVDPEVLKQRYDEKGWEKYRKEKIKKTNKKSETIKIPSVETFTIRKTGKIIRAIEAAILEATNLQPESEEEQVEIVKRMYYLKLYLANKPHLIAAALNTLNENQKPPAPRWKNILYRANKENIQNERDQNFEVNNRSVVHFGENSAYYTAYTKDDDTTCSGYVCAISNGESQTEAHLVAKLATTLLSKLQPDKDNYDQDIKDIVEQVELEIEDKTDEFENPKGVSLLAYRFFTNRIVGVNIGDSMLLVVDPNKKTTNQLLDARQYKDGNKILIPDNYVAKYDIKILDQKIFESESIFIALSGDTIKKLEKTQSVNEQNTEVFKYVKYSLTKEALARVLENSQDHQAIINAKTCANKLNSDGEDTTIVCMQKTDQVFIPAYQPPAQLENEETAERKARIKAYLTENFDLNGMSRSKAICVRRILEADFRNLSDYASHFTAEKNAGNYESTLAGALKILNTEFTFTDANGHTFFRRWAEEDQVIDDNSIIYDPKYNREFASRLIKCAHSLSKNNFREGVGNFGSSVASIFSSNKSPKIDWDLAQNAIAGKLAKSLISCRTLVMYEAWRDNANHVYEHLNKKSLLHKVLTEIFRDLEKAVSVTPYDEKYNVKLLPSN